MRTAWAPIVALATSVSLPAIALAQVTTADLIGRVADTSGAVLPGVTVTVTQTGTGAMRTQTTSESADYAFSLLPIGAYEISNVGNSIARQMQCAARFTF